MHVRCRIFTFSLKFKSTHPRDWSEKNSKYPAKAGARTVERGAKWAFELVFHCFSSSAASRARPSAGRVFAVGSLHRLFLHSVRCILPQTKTLIANFGFASQFSRSLRSTIFHPANAVCTRLWAFHFQFDDAIKVHGIFHREERPSTAAEDGKYIFIANGKKQLLSLLAPPSALLSYN